MSDKYPKITQAVTDFQKKEQLFAQLWDTFRKIADNPQLGIAVLESGYQFRFLGETFRLRHERRGPQHNRMRCVLERVVFAPNGEIREHRRLAERSIDTLGNAYLKDDEDSTSYNIKNVADFEGAVALWLAAAINDIYAS